MNRLNMSPTSQLKSAISSKDNEAVSKLLGKMDIETVNRVELNEAALHVACEKKNHDALDLLLAMTGIDVNVKTKAGCAPLHAALYTDNLHAASKLLGRSEIDVNAKLSNGCTPLHLACRRNHHSIVGKLLIIPDIDANAEDNYGDTPIMECAPFCNKEALKVMLGDPQVNLAITDKKKKVLEEKVGTFSPSKEERDMCLKMIKKERRRKEIDKAQIYQAGSIGKCNVKIEKIRKEIGIEEEKRKKNLEIRKRKMDDLIEKQTMDKKILATKYKEKLSLLENNQRQEIATLQDTFAREDEYEQRYVASLKEQRDELAQNIEKLTIDAGNGAYSDERCKSEPFKRSLECPICMVVMRPPTKIWMCRFTHVICEECKDQLKVAKGGNCPTCASQSFIGRNYMAEDLYPLHFA